LNITWAAAIVIAIIWVMAVGDTWSAIRRRKEPWRRWSALGTLLGSTALLILLAVNRIAMPHSWGTAILSVGVIFAGLAVVLRFIARLRGDPSANQPRINGN
jgi:hypothetical protein